MTQKEHRTGRTGEEIAMSVLSAMGIEMVEIVATPTLLTPVKGKPGAFYVRWGKKVSGDVRGILPGGRSVLGETKTILHRNLQYSDLRPHQPAQLSKHAEMGGLSLLIWVHGPDEIYVMQWPVAGFGPGKGITPEIAKSLSAMSVETIGNEEETFLGESDEEEPKCKYCGDTGYILEGDTERQCGYCYEPPGMETMIRDLKDENELLAGIGKESCICPKDGMPNAFCPIHGARATGHSLR